MIYKTNKYKNHTWFIGVMKKFQGIGLVFAMDNPIHFKEYFLIELRFLFIKVWYTYYY